MQQTCEVDGLLLVCSSVRLNLDEFRVADNLLQTMDAHLTQILSNLLCKEGEEINHVFDTTLEMLP